MVIATLDGEELEDRLPGAFVYDQLAACIALPATDKRTTLDRCKCSGYSQAGMREIVNYE